MLHKKNSDDSRFDIAWPIVIGGAVAGLFISWGILSGDLQGRVNILYLLLVYLLIPLMSIFVSLISLLFGNGINLSRFLTKVPLWTRNYSEVLRKIRQQGGDKFWFLMQSQIAALAFSLASLFTFFLLLLATDMNFVWRSTILSEQDILSLLNFVATPWQFWGSAQPDVFLLESTRDSRLVINSSSHLAYGGWWQFILAIQLFYSLLPRIVLFLIFKLCLKRSFADKAANAEPYKTSVSFVEPSYNSSSVCSRLPTSIGINNWADVPVKLLSQCPEIDISSSQLFSAGPTASPSEVENAEQWKAEQLVIVKSWEPPLGELADFLNSRHGYLLPLDWDNEGLSIPKANHLQEWQRFSDKFGQWQMFLPDSLNPERVMNE